MRYELIAVLGVLLCLVILGVEYLWLYILAGRQEDAKNKYDTAKLHVAKMVEGIIYCPTKSARSDETEQLKKYIGNDTQILEIVCKELASWQGKTDELVMGNKRADIDEIYAEINPVEMFGKVLEEGESADKSYACRRLADFGATAYLPQIRELSQNKKRDVAYNAAMALSRLGDTKALADFILRIQDDKKYSYRIIMELFCDFTGNREQLADMVFAGCNEYMKLTTIKAIAPYKLEKYEAMFIDGIKGVNPSMKVACIKALGMLEKEENEQYLLTYARDNDWVVRSSAIKGLQRLHSPQAIQGVKDATKDKEWWVRQAAAQALLAMKVPISDLEDIMKGYDKYAADAVKYSLYRAVDLKGEDGK